MPISDGWWYFIRRRAMKQDLFVRVGMALITLLLILNLTAALGGRAVAQSRSGDSAPIRYKVVRIDAATNQDLLFQKAGEEGAELVGTIQVFGSTGYLIFKK